MELEDLKPSCCLGMCCALAGDIFLCAYFSGCWFVVEGVVSSFVLAVSFLLLGAILEWFCFDCRGSSTKVVNCVW